MDSKKALCELFLELDSFFLAEYGDDDLRYIEANNYYNELFNIIERDLNVLEIIAKKCVSIENFKYVDQAKTYKEYCKNYSLMSLPVIYFLSKSEFDTLKKWISNNCGNIFWV